jgi:plasmid stabilization system protein ParE
MPNVLFHAAADAEYQEAYAWYYARSELAADRFEEAIARALEEIAARPERGLPFGRKHRCRLVKRLPYHIV